jgi:pimeloyl-ACP methyl ester carboxylesterase
VWTAGLRHGYTGSGGERAARRRNGMRPNLGEWHWTGGRTFVPFSPDQMVQGTQRTSSAVADRSLWMERRLRVVTVERPGFGVSTRLPGRGFAEHADDLAAVIDYLRIERLPVFGGSGAAPHALAFAARHPERVAAVTILDGAAPMTEDELDSQVEANVIADRLARARAVEPLRTLLEAQRTAILADPVAALRAMIDGAPDDDHELIDEPDWPAGPGRGFLEALAHGVDGWLDELLAIDGDWADIDLDAVTTSVTWWHSETDRNTPFGSARRLVARLPNARFVVLDGNGHLAGYRQEAEILDELLARAEGGGGEGARPAQPWEATQARQSFVARSPSPSTSGIQR